MRLDRVTLNSKSSGFVEIFLNQECASLDIEICSVGISPHANLQLGDIELVELPEIDKIVDMGDAAAVI